MAQSYRAAHVGERAPNTQHRNAPQADSLAEASDIAIVFSLAELTNLPAAPAEEIPPFEPWSTQEPEPAR